MPGPVSDSYDPEWGTAANGDKIKEALRATYQRVSTFALESRPPIWIMELVDMDLPKMHGAMLSEKDWRLIRFALERACDSI